MNPKFALRCRDVCDRVVAVIVVYFDTDAASIRLKPLLMKNLGLDSNTGLGLLFQIQDEFDSCVEDDDVRLLRIVAGILASMRRRTAQATC